MSELAHNHMTPVIEARGVCPKCDLWRDGLGGGGDLAYMNQITDENARLTVEFNQLNERFRAHRDISKLEMEELWALIGEFTMAISRHKKWAEALHPETDLNAPGMPHDRELWAEVAVGYELPDQEGEALPSPGDET